MTHTSYLIIKDLGVSQSTADSIAGRLDLPESRIAALLRELISLGYAESFPLLIAGKPALTIYRLTSKEYPH